MSSVFLLPVSTTFNRADKYTASSVDYYTETTDQPYTDAPHPRRFNNIDSIMAQISDPERSSEAIDQITEVIRAKHNLKDGQLATFHLKFVIFIVFFPFIKNKFCSFIYFLPNS